VFLSGASLSWGHAMAQLVEALPYNLEGRGFVSRWGHWNFSLTQSFGTQWTQPVGVVADV
jgi:hypothetical protein